MNKKKAVILIGPPGSGKSAIAVRLIENERIAAVETGNLLREEVDKKTSTGKIIENNMSSGKIVPTEIVQNIIIEKLKNKSEQYILFDGFPRIDEQINAFFNISEVLKINLKKVIILKLEDEIIRKRLLGRRICEKCGQVYNIFFDPPAKEDECSRCGGKLKKRKDDTPEIVEERINHYKEYTLKVAEFFKKNYSEKTAETDAEQEISLITEKIEKYLLN